jgi:hypothetical protein
MAADQVSSPKLMESAFSAPLLNSVKSQLKKKEMPLKSKKFLSQKRFTFLTQKSLSPTLLFITERTTFNSKERVKVMEKRAKETDLLDTQDLSKFILLTHSSTPILAT